jgi:uncharacterized protein (UPF0332 family)
MKPEVAVLLAKAASSRRAAALLATQDYLDFAASRAYYALFYAAEALLLADGLSFSSHSAVIAGFGKTFAKSQRLDPRFHRYLLDAQDLRNLGDYGIGTGVSIEELAELLAWAGEFLAAATAFLEADAPNDEAGVSDDAPA